MPGTVVVEVRKLALNYPHLGDAGGRQCEQCCRLMSIHVDHKRSDLRTTGDNLFDLIKRLTFNPT